MAVSWLAKRAEVARPNDMFWSLLIGVPVGLLFLLATQLEAKWFFFLFCGSFTGAASLVPSDRKAYYLALLVFTLPILVDVNLYYHPSAVRHSTSGLVIQLSHLPLVALYCIWGLHRIATKLPLGVSTTGLLPLSTVFLAGVISVLLAKDPVFGVFDLFALAISITLFIYTASEVREPREVSLVLWVLMVAMALQGVIALGQYATGSTLGLEFFGASQKSGQPPGLAALTRVAGTLGHPNNLALLFDLLLPLGFSLLFYPMKRSMKALLAVAVGLGGLGLGATLSRGGIMATGLALSIILLVRWRERIGWLRACFALLTVAVLFVLVILGPPNPIQERFFAPDYGSAYGRIPIMKVAFNMIRDRPFFGVGLNNYTEAAGRYDHTPEQISVQWNAPVHNLFLFVAGEIGLIGLGSFLFFLVIVVRALLPALRSPDPLSSHAGLGLLSGLLAFFAHAQVDYSNWSSFSLFWLMLGLAVSVGRLASAPVTVQKEGRP